MSLFDFAERSCPENIKQEPHLNVKRFPKLLFVKEVQDSWVSQETRAKLLMVTPDQPVNL
jgi:hypothetical protein